MLCAPVLAVAVVLSAAPPDDRLVLSAPNLQGHQGVLRTTSALIDDTGAGVLGLNTRFFVTPDFILEDIEDSNTFVEGGAAAGFSFFRLVEVSLSTRAGANLNSARAQPVSSVGDSAIGLKAGTSFGLAAVAAGARLGLPTRANKVGFDLENLPNSYYAAASFDLLQIDVPVRVHVNGGYTAQPGQLAEDGFDKFLLEGPDGGLVALAANQWFWDQAWAGLGVEVPLPYVTPFVEMWFQTAVLPKVQYTLPFDSHTILTPGVRAGYGGLRVDVAADIGLTGLELKDGQPVNLPYGVRINVAHAFDLSAGGGGGGGGGSFSRFDACVVDETGPVPSAVVALNIDGQPGPRFVADDKGCVSAPVQPGAWTATASDANHPAVTVPVERGSPATIKLVTKAQTGRIAGFITNKEDETIDVVLAIKDGGMPGWREGGATTGGAFDLEVKAGPVVIIAKADGYLSQSARYYLEPGERQAKTLVMRKIPKKRSATLVADKIETTARVPFEFKKPRLQSTAEYLFDELADILLTNQALKLSIEAHTDPTEIADATEAKTLTEARAQAVKDALVDRGIDAARLETAGYGIQQPLAPNDPKNRRVEFLVIK